MLLVLLAFGEACADGNDAATVTRLDGTLWSRRADGTERLLSVGSVISEGETLSTSQQSYARLKFLDTTDLTLRPRTRIRIEAFRFEADKPESDRFVLNMLRGGLRAITGLVGHRRDRSQVEYKVVTATIGVRGTEFSAIYCQPGSQGGGNDCDDVKRENGKPIEDGLYVEVNEGAISVANAAGELIVAAGDFAYVRDRESPPVRLPRSEGVQFTAPPAISAASGSGLLLDVSRSRNQCVVN